MAGCGSEGHDEHNHLQEMLGVLMPKPEVDRLDLQAALSQEATLTSLLSQHVHSGLLLLPCPQAQRCATRQGQQGALFSPLMEWGQVP